MILVAPVVMASLFYMSAAIPVGWLNQRASRSGQCTANTTSAKLECGLHTMPAL